jgi:hypothetical protein
VAEAYRFVRCLKSSDSLFISAFSRAHFVPVNSQANFRLARDLLIANCLFLSRSVKGDSAEWHAINPQLPLPTCWPGISQRSARRYAVLSDPW